MSRTGWTHRGTFLAIVPVITLLAISSVAHVAYAVSSSTQLTSPNPQLDGQFGFSVAISGEAVAVGAYGEQRVYVFDAADNSLITTITNPNPLDQGEFGYSVAIDGSTLVVGSPQAAVGTVDHAGHAYVFNATTGNLISTLNTPDPQTIGNFGWSVAISDTTAVVGAMGETEGAALQAGRAYVFNATTSDLISTLISPNSQFRGAFGYSVGVYVDDGTVVVGAPFEAVGESQAAGNAYVFDATTAGLLHTLTSPNPQGTGNFGVSVAISESLTIVVGARGESEGTFGGAGNAYVFDATTGDLTQTLTSANPAAGGAFGQSVAIVGTTAVVGAPLEPEGTASDAGHAYVFDAASGALLNTLTSPNAQLDGEFGQSVAISYDAVVVGAPGETVDSTAAAGNAYIF